MASKMQLSCTTQNQYLPLLLSLGFIITIGMCRYCYAPRVSLPIRAICKCPVLLNYKGLKVSSSQHGRAGSVRSFEPIAFLEASAQQHHRKFWCMKESLLASGMLILGRVRPRYPSISAKQDQVLWYIGLI